MLPSSVSSHARAIGQRERDYGRGRTVLVADDDIAFVFWLGAVLAEAGYQVVPATNCAQVLSRMNKLKGKVDVVILNPALRGAFQLPPMLEKSGIPLRIVLSQEPGTRLSGTFSSYPNLEKPSAPVSCERWCHQLHKTLNKSNLVPVV